MAISVNTSMAKQVGNQSNLTQHKLFIDNFAQYDSINWRQYMKTSARNQFLGTVKSITQGQVFVEVVLDIGGGDELVASITGASLAQLGLSEGKEAYALFKASWIILATDDSLKTSTRNRLCGVLTQYREGAVNAEVVIELPGGQTLAAIVTDESFKTLGLKKGMRVCALIKASHIILAVAS